MADEGTIKDKLSKIAASLDHASRLPNLPTNYRYHAVVLRDHLKELGSVFEEVDAFFARVSEFAKRKPLPRIEHRKGPRK